jgi:hypothetical protein
MADPMKSQEYRTQRSELPEDLWQPLYDRVNYAVAGASQLSFFSVPKGQSATLLTTYTAATFTYLSGAKSKTYRDTNIENSNVVPTKLFKTVGISWGMFHSVLNAAGNASDREVIRQGGFLQFRIVDKDIIFLPLSLIPEVNPMVASTANSINGYAGGGGQNVPMYKFPIPITLNPYENFLVTMQFDFSPVPTTTLDVQCVLHAYMRRPT